jgi:acetolactate synthase-1/2/3 large subunit
VASCAEVLAVTLRDEGVVRMFGLPGGEILHFIEAARKAGIEFVLTRHEAVAALMADVTGQLTRRPGVCVSTLGPGAMNLTLGVANAFLDRSPVIAITAATPESARPYATHQQLDLNAVFRPFTKKTVTLDGVNTAATVRRAWRTAVEPRPGPVHLALPSDVATREEQQTEDPRDVSVCPGPLPPPSREALNRVAAEINGARRPIVVLGLDLDSTAAPVVRRFVEALGVPVFVTPKSKGVLPEDHEQFLGVCGGLAADAVILDFFHRADLLIGVGFDPVESDKLWHHTMRLVSIASVSIAADAYRPMLEVTGDVVQSLTALLSPRFGPFDWTTSDVAAFRAELERTLSPMEGSVRSGISPLGVTRRLRGLFPPDTIVTTDVGSIKLLVSQAWRTTEPLTFLESNGLSAMGYALPAAMAAKFLAPERPVLCTIGDGGYSMVFADLETAVRHRLRFVTVVYNDSALSLIQVAQERRGYPDYGVRYGHVDFAAASAALGAWARRVRTIAELDAAVMEAVRHDGPSVVEVMIDPAEYRAHLGITSSAARQSP